MAKINYRSQFAYGFAGQPVTVRAQVAIGASGAPTIASATGMGVESITRNGAGDYSVALSQAFYALMDCRAVFESGSSAPAAPLMNIRTNSVSSTSAPLIRIQFRDVSGTAADPASGEILHLSIEMNRSSTGY